MTGVRDYLCSRATNLARDKLRVSRCGALVIRAREHQSRLVDRCDRVAQIDLRARKDVGIAHPRISLDLLHPPFANHVEVFLHRLRRIAIGIECLRRPTHRDPAQSFDSFGRQVELRRRATEDQRLDARGMP
jgi:hypothetical protein